MESCVDAGLIATLLLALVQTDFGLPELACEVCKSVLGERDYKHPASLARLEHVKVSLLDMKSTHQHYLRHIGDSLKLACEFEIPYFHLFDNPVLWKKRQKNEEIQINIQGNINDPFQQQNRFQVNFDPKPPYYNFDLVISPLTKYDNGNYTCEIRGPGSTILGTVTHQVTVRVPVTSMYMTNFNHSNETSAMVPRRMGEYFFTEGEPGTLHCGASGGYPVPQIQLSVGMQDVTAPFSTRYQPIFEGQFGLRVMGYKVDSWTYTFMALPEYDGKELECAALVSGLPPNTTSTKIRVSYAPRIKCYPAVAYLSQRNVSMTCLVTSRPRASEITWSMFKRGRNIILGGSDSRSGYWTYNQVTDETSIMSTLMISHVTSNHFREYIIIARNRVAQHSSTAVLTEVPATTTTVSTTTTTTKYSENNGMASNGKPYYIIASSGCPTLSKLRCLVIFCVQFIGLLAELLMRR